MTPLASHLSSSPELKQPMDREARAISAAQMLVGTTNWSAPQAFYDVAPDGKKFLLNRIVQQVAQSVTVITNFSAGLKQK